MAICSYTLLGKHYLVFQVHAGTWQLTACAVGEVMCSVFLNSTWWPQETFRSSKWDHLTVQLMFHANSKLLPTPIHSRLTPLAEELNLYVNSWRKTTLMKLLKQMIWLLSLSSRLFWRWVSLRSFVSLFTLCWDQLLNCGYVKSSSTQQDSGTKGSMERFSYCL